MAEPVKTPAPNPVAGQQKPLTPQSSRPELKQPTPGKASPFDYFTKRMEEVLVAKGEEKFGVNPSPTLMDFIHGVDEQVKKVRHYIQTNELDKAKKHMIHIANYAFLASTKLKV